MPSPLHNDLIKLLEQLRHKRAFNATEWIDKKTDMFNDYMRQCGLKAAIVSVSGGIDSAATLSLIHHAMQKPDSPIEKILGIAQPIKSTSSIQNRAYELGEMLGVEIITVDQSDLHTQLSQLTEKAAGIDGTGFARGQLRSYMRVPVQYYVAQLLSASGLPCIVMGTGNLDEDGYLLYFCKAGDGVCDVQLIADLHKSEVRTVSEALNVPKSIIGAAPSADLWEGQTDEDELGVSYAFVELLTEWMFLDEVEQKKSLDQLSAEALEQWNKFKGIAAAVHRRNKHKLNPPLNINILPTLEMK